MLTSRERKWQCQMHNWCMLLRWPRVKNNTRENF